MIQTYSQIADYFESMAAANVTLSHGATIAGTTRTRNSFITLDDEDAFVVSETTGIDFPCMVMVSLSAMMLNLQTDYRKSWAITFHFLDKINTIAHPSEAAAKKACLLSSEAVMMQFISKLWEIFLRQDSTSVIKEIDLPKFRWSRTGRVGDNNYGWKLSFAFDTLADDIINCDNTQWNSF